MCLGRQRQWGTIAPCLLVYLLLGSSLYTPAAGAPGSGSGGRYSLIIDSGSSGTRIYAYTWQAAKSAGQLPLVQAVKPSQAAAYIPRKAKTGLYERVETQPGLAQLVGDVGSIQRHGLGPLLDWAKAVVPKGSWACTPIFLLATAGVRKLPPQQQAQLMSAVRATLAASGFRFEPHWARIITGAEEGAFGWVAANYLASGGGAPGSPSSSSSTTAAAAVQGQAVSQQPQPPGQQLGVRFQGTLDLGGSSLEVTQLKASVPVIAQGKSLNSKAAAYHEYRSQAGIRAPISSDVTHSTGEQVHEPAQSTTQAAQVEAHTGSSSGSVHPPTITAAGPRETQLMVCNTQYQLVTQTYRRYGLSDTFDRSITLLIQELLDKSSILHIASSVDLRPSDTPQPSHEPGTSLPAAPSPEQQAVQPAAYNSQFVRRPGLPPGPPPPPGGDAARQLYFSPARQLQSSPSSSPAAPATPPAAPARQAAEEQQGAALYNAGLQTDHRQQEAGTNQQEGDPKAHQQGVVSIGGAEHVSQVDSRAGVSTGVVAKQTTAAVSQAGTGDRALLSRDDEVRLPFREGQDHGGLEPPGRARAAVALGSSGLVRQLPRMYVSGSERAMPVMGVWQAWVTHLRNAASCFRQRFTTYSAAAGAPQLVMQRQWDSGGALLTGQLQAATQHPGRALAEQKQPGILSTQGGSSSVQEASGVGRVLYEHMGHHAGAVEGAASRRSGQAPSSLGTASQGTGSVLAGKDPALASSTIDSQGVRDEREVDVSTRVVGSLPVVSQAGNKSTGSTGNDGAIQPHRPAGVTLHHPCLPAGYDATYMRQHDYGIMPHVRLVRLLGTAQHSLCAQMAATLVTHSFVLPCDPSSQPASPAQPANHWAAAAHTVHSTQQTAVTAQQQAAYHDLSAHRGLGAGQTDVSSISSSSKAVTSLPDAADRAVAALHGQTRHSQMPCDHGIAAAQLQGQVMALTGFYVVWRFFLAAAAAGSTSRPNAHSREALAAAVQHVCDQPWSHIQKRLGHHINVEKYCLWGRYVLELLGPHGLNLSQAQVTIGSGDVGWTLGATLAEVSREVPQLMTAPPATTGVKSLWAWLRPQREAADWCSSTSQLGVQKSVRVIHNTTAAFALLVLALSLLAWWLKQRWRRVARVLRPMVAAIWGRHAPTDHHVRYSGSSLPVSMPRSSTSRSRSSMNLMRIVSDR